MDRRDILKTITLSSFLSYFNQFSFQQARAATQTSIQLPKFTVDVHAHFIPEIYRKALISAGHSQPDGMPGIPPWKEESALSLMNRLGIQTSMLSISSPGVYFGDATAARKLAREVNELGIQIVKKNPNRFGLFASLPLPDIQGAIAEAIYALDILKADGVVLETNYHGLYLGDTRLSPLYEELSKRKAIIFIHPTSPNCSGCKALSFGYPFPMIEFMFDTTRSVTDLILGGSVMKNPGIRWIIPHAGSALSIFAERIASFANGMKLASGVSGNDFTDTLKTFYYDLAGSPLPHQLPALLSMADPTKILYGSDTPFTFDQGVLTARDLLLSTKLLSQNLRTQIFSTNARDLFPRLSKGN